MTPGGFYNAKMLLDISIGMFQKNWLLSLASY